MSAFNLARRVECVSARGAWRENSIPTPMTQITAIRARKALRIDALSIAHDRLVGMQ